MTIMHKECLCTELGALPNGAQGVAGVTKFVGADCALHVLPALNATLKVSDEGTSLTTAATELNFVGAGVTANGAGTVVTVNVPKPTAWVWGAAGDGSATITFSDGSTLAVPAMPFTC